MDLAGHPVGRIGFGAMQLEPRDGEDDGPLVAVLRRAVDLGVRHLDTAEFYGAGTVNGLIRSALAPYPDDLVVVTKVGARRSGDGRLVPAQRPHELRGQVEENLRSLGLDRLPVVNLRRVDAPPGIVATGDQVVDLDDQLAELARLRDDGKVGAVGLSSVTTAQLEAAAPAGIACVQDLFNLLDRRDRPTLDACARTGAAYVPFFPLGSGFAGRDRVTDDPRVRAVAARLGATPAQVGLAWLLAQGPHVLLIPGTRSLAHLAENLAAAELVLDDATLAELADAD